MIVFGIHEGVQAMPKMYGSDIREAGKITDFSSGVTEAAKVCTSFIRPIENLTEPILVGPFLRIL